MQTECACSLEAAVLNAGAHASQSRWKFSRGYKGMHGFKRVSLVSFPLCVCIYMCVYMYVYINVYIHAAAAAKLLQLCLTLCDPIDGSSPGSSVPGTLQARVLEVGAIAFSSIYTYSFLKPTCLRKLLGWKFMWLSFFLFPFPPVLFPLYEIGTPTHCPKVWDPFWCSAKGCVKYWW